MKSKKTDNRLVNQDKTRDSSALNRAECRPSVKLVSIPAIIFTVLLVLKFIFFNESFWFAETWRLIVILFSSLTIYLYVSRLTTTYAFTDQEVSVCIGIFSKQTSAAPLSRITNFELRRPFLKRIFGLADLMIDTPGGTGFEIRMLEMNLSDAIAFRKRLSEFSGHSET